VGVLTVGITDDIFVEPATLPDAAQDRFDRLSRRPPGSDDHDDGEE
jgi:hypothetical protein